MIYLSTSRKYEWRPVGQSVFVVVVAAVLLMTAAAAVAAAVLGSVAALAVLLTASVILHLFYHGFLACMLSMQLDQPPKIWESKKTD